MEYKAEMRRRRRSKIIGVTVMLLLIAALTVALAYVASRMLTGKALFDAKVPVSAATQLSASASNPDAASAASASTAPAVQAWNTATPIAERTVNTETKVFDSRMAALPANGKVTIDYFNDALFIGDSLAQGFGIYPPMMGHGICAGYKGVSIQYITQNATGNLPDGKAVAMWDYIAQQTPGKIYLVVGTNSLVGQENDALLKYYGDLLDKLTAQFPGVPIYINSITPVTAETAASRPALDNDRIRLLNNSIALMAQQRGLYYLNLHEVFEDGSGALRADLAGSDGIHMRDKTGYEIWTDYLETHTAYSEANTAFLEQPYNVG